MQVCVTSEQRFLGTPDGGVWTEAQYPHEFWRAYLDGFDEVIVVARVMRVDRAERTWQRVDGPNVRVHCLPGYHGPRQFAGQYVALGRTLAGVLSPERAVILRVASPIGSRAAAILRRRGQPFGVEVVGDPWDTFASGAVRHPLRPLFRRILARGLARVCREAAAAAYVTQVSLQKRYPPRPGAFTTSYSSVRLTVEAVASRRPRTMFDGGFHIVSIGSMEQMYKGFDILLQAAARCVQGGLDLRLTIVGDGRHRQELEGMSIDVGLASRTAFTGQLPAGDAVRQKLDDADLFVLASRTEGLPRAMIEAMARGLPCLGTNVGGIPELLPESCLVSVNDAPALAAAIHDLSRDPALRARLGEANMARARDYLEDGLSVRRRELYRVVREATERWQRDRTAKDAGAT